MRHTERQAAKPVIGPETQILGMQHIVSAAFASQDPMPFWNAGLARIQSNPFDATAMHDLATIMQAFRLPGDPMTVLKGAVSLQKDYCVVHGKGTGPRILAFVTAGDFMANIPVDFLLNHSDCVLWLHYVDGETQSLSNLPDHDTAIMAIGEGPENAAALARMAALLPRFKGHVLNNNPELILQLTRDGVSDMLAHEPSILMPQQVRSPRAALAIVAQRLAPLALVNPALSYPLVIRPVGTQAGIGLARLTSADELALYLAGQPEAEFYVAPFIDYAGTDGLYNKQRVVFIAGKPYASHMALSSHWIVHYLSAGMAEDAAKRSVEAHWMEHFDTDYAQRHAEAFAALHRIIGLDYFGIDCAELPDGRLLVFELDVAMIVHDMDDAATFPYKKPAMLKLFKAFVEAAQPPRSALAADAA